MKALKKYLKKQFPSLYRWAYDTFRAPKRYNYIFSSIKKVKAKNILEVGVYNGVHAAKMIKVAKRFNPDVSYYGFDLFEDLTEDVFKKEISKRPPTKSQVENLLKATGADIHLFSGNTLISLPAALPDLPKMDFIFIDGGHSNETVKSDWNSVKSLMHENTIVLFDDYWHNRTDQGAKSVVDAIDTTTYWVEILPVIDSFDNVDFGRLDISFAKVTLR